MVLQALDLEYEEAKIPWLLCLSVHTSYDWKGEKNV